MQTWLNPTQCTNLVQLSSQGFTPDSLHYSKGIHTLEWWLADVVFRGASRKKLLNHHSKTERKKEFMMFCHSCIKLWFMVKDAGKRAKHTHQWCEGRDHPPYCPPHHFYNPQGLLWGLQVRDLQQQHLRCAHRFLWGAKWAIIPSNPSAGFPKGKEFSLNPKEKYLYMDFYDSKSVLAIDLSPLFGWEKLSWKALLPNAARHSQILYCTYKQMSEASQRMNPGKNNRVILSLRLYYLCHTNK